MPEVKDDPRGPRDIGPKPQPPAGPPPKFAPPDRAPKIISAADAAKAAAAKAAAAVSSMPRIIATHTIKEGETLDQLATKYYGNAGKPFWSLIYEFNKTVIGKSERDIKPGMVLKIPDLTPNLKAQLKK